MNCTAVQALGSESLRSYSCQGFFFYCFVLHSALYFRMCVAVVVYNETKSDLHKGFQKLNLSSRVILLSLLPSQEYNRASEL